MCLDKPILNCACNTFGTEMWGLSPSPPKFLFYGATAPLPSCSAVYACSNVSLKCTANLVIIHICFSFNTAYQYFNIDLFLFCFCTCRYTLCRSATKSSYINLDSRTNEEVKTHTKYICVVSSFILANYLYTV